VDGIPCGVMSVWFEVYDSDVRCDESEEAHLCNALVEATGRVCRCARPPFELEVMRYHII